MRHRRSNANAMSADFVDYLVTRRGLSQNEIADILQVDKSFISRVRNAERDFPSRQLRVLADQLDVPLGAMLIDSRPPGPPPTGEIKQIADLCEKLLRQGDAAIAAHRAKRAAAG